VIDISRYTVYSIDPNENLQRVPVVDLFESPRNPRKTFHEGRLAELAASIRDKGILTPLLVLPTGEILAGHRRYRAAQMAGQQLVPVICRDLDERSALEVMTIDNLQREDINPLEEGQGYQELLELADYTVEDLAAKVGKSESYIRGRLKLTSLIPEVCEAFLHSQITFGHARLLAALDSGQQAKALDEGCFDGDENRETLSPVSELKHWIRTHGHRDLDLACFDRADETLEPAAGACTTCPHASGANLSLLPTEDGEVCTWAECFDGKTKAHIARRVAEGLVAICPVWQPQSVPAGALFRQQYDAIQEDGECDHIELGIVVPPGGGEYLPYPYKVGQEGHICRTPSCDVHGAALRARQTPAKSSNNTAPGKQKDHGEAARQQAEKAAEQERQRVRELALAAILSDDWTAAIKDDDVRSWLLYDACHRNMTIDDFAKLLADRSIPAPPASTRLEHSELLRKWAEQASHGEANALIIEIMLRDHLVRYAWQEVQPDLLAIAAEATGRPLPRIATERKS
jgi:ParB family transcriptional regulator, chromosome partitioning protein